MLLLTAFLIALTMSVAMIPLTMKVSTYFDWVDHPGARKIHIFPIPRHGGVAIFLASIAILPLMTRITLLEPVSPVILYGAVAALVLGLMDDFTTLSAKHKLIGQLLLGVFAYVGGFQIHNIHLGLLSIHAGFMSLPITMLWVALVMNAFNMIDGMDGLATTYATVAFLSFGLLANQAGNISMALLCLVMAGSLLGFFLFNFHPAKIFMGDSGSMMLGYMLSVVSITSLYQNTSSLMWAPLFFLAYPMLELGLSISRRTVRYIQQHKAFHPMGILKATMQADGDHIHHRLLKMKFSQRKVNLVLFVYTLISCALGFLLIDQTFVVITGSFALFILATLLLVKTMRYDQFDRNHPKQDRYLLGKKFGREAIIKKVGSNG